MTKKKESEYYVPKPGFNECTFWWDFKERDAYYEPHVYILGKIPQTFEGE